MPSFPDIYSVAVPEPRGRPPRLFIERQQKNPGAHRGSRVDAEKLRYIYPPPLADGDVVPEGKIPTAPYTGAPSYKLSVYYYWWAFLREHDGYLDYCRAPTGGAFADLYAAFGDVRSEDFWGWWCDRGYKLFHENDTTVDIVSSAEVVPDAQKEILLKVPLNLDVDTVVDQIRALLRRHRNGSDTGDRESTAIFPVTGKPILSSLHKALKMLQARRAHSDVTYPDLYALSGLKGYGVGDQSEPSYDATVSNEARRLLREAHRLVACAVRGTFPQDKSEPQTADANAIGQGAEPTRTTTNQNQSKDFGLTGHSLPPMAEETAELVKLLSPLEQRSRTVADRRRNLEATLKRWDDAQFRAISPWLWQHFDYVKHTMRRPDTPAANLPTRVLFLVAADVDAEKLDENFLRGLVSLQRNTDTVKHLYRMAVLQNRLPLHWCLAVPMFHYGRDQRRSADQATHPPLSQHELTGLIELLPQVRAIVLLGEEVQAAWDANAPLIGDWIKVWRCDHPTDKIRKEAKARWLTIPSQLPTWDDVYG